jgi:hypothetical protein
VPWRVNAERFRKPWNRSSRRRPKPVPSSFRRSFFVVVQGLAPRLLGQSVEIPRCQVPVTLVQFTLTSRRVRDGLRERVCAFQMLVFEEVAVDEEADEMECGEACAILPGCGF